MRVLVSLRSRLALLTTVLTVMLSGFSLYMFSVSISRTQYLEMNQDRIDLANTINELSTLQALVRGVGNVIVGGNKTLLTEFDELSRKCDRIKGRLEEKIGMVEGDDLLSDDFRNDFRDWKGSYLTLMENRELLKDGDITSEAWLDSTTRIISSLTHMRTQLFSPRNETEAILYYNGVIRPTAIELGEFAGRERALIGNLLASERGMLKSNGRMVQQELQEYRSRTRHLAERITEQQDFAHTPESLKEKIKIFERHFFGKYETIRQNVYETQQRNQQLIADGISELSRTRETMIRNLHGVENDLQSLVGNPQLRDVVSGKTTDLARVQYLFEDIAELRKQYAQIRYLDKTGMEIVRVDYDCCTTIIPAHQLQNKASRYYFRESLPLQAGGIYLSPLDLNVEKGQIEKPFKPMLRYVAPVYSGEEFRGAVIINYLARILLDQIPTGMMLVSREGDYLCHPDSTKEWGMMEALNRQEFNFLKDYPEAATVVFSEAAGMVYVNKAFLLYTRVVHPGDPGKYWMLMKRIELIQPSIDSGEWLRAATDAINSSLDISSVAGARSTDILNRERAKARVFLGISVVTSLLVVLIIFLLTGGALQVNTRLQETRRVLQQITQGCLSSRIGLRNHGATATPDEIDEIGGTINQMAATLETTIGDLQKSRDDLTARVRERTAELEGKKGVLESIFQSVSDVLVITDVNRRIVMTNPAVTRVFGYDSNELQGEQTVVLYASEEEFRRQGELRFNSHAVGDHDPYEVNYKRKDGTIFPADTLGTAIRDRHGTVTGFMGVIRDITQRKEADKKLKEAYDDLELRVEHRTYELLEVNRELQRSAEELVDAKLLAEAANSAKSEFLANMSHEIRTPMNAILGFTEILKSKETDPRKSHFLESIHSAGNSLLRLINDILDLSKIEAGKMELQYTSASLKNLFKDIHTIFDNKLREKGLAWSLEFDDDLPSAFVLDEIRLRQVLINLIGNAIKFTESGYVKLILSGVESKEAGARQFDLIITVEDSGIGIPKEQQKKIFDAFEQTKGQDVQQYAGTGLGLTISRRLVEMMSGGIRLESQVGKGSRFIITLKGVDVAASGISLVGTTQLHTDELSFPHKLILVADDIDHNRELIESFLSGWDFSIITAENGADAVKQANDHHPDLILLDMKMPVMDGYQASRELKDGENTNEIPIIAVTASALKQDEVIIRKLCDGYLRKPIQRDDLVGEIMKFLPFTRVEHEQPVEEKENLPLDDHDTLQLFAKLSEETLEEISCAALTADIDELSLIATRIHSENEQLAAILKKNSLAFHYEIIDRFCQNALEMKYGGSEPVQ